MISIIDIIFIILAVVLVALSISRGFVVSFLSMIRLFIIVPASYYLGKYIGPYIPKEQSYAVDDVLFNIIVCVVCFFVLLFLSGLLLLLLKKLQKKKGMPLRHTNAFLGGVLGLAKTLVIVVFASTVLGFLMKYSSSDESLYQAIDSSYIVSIVNEYNPLIK